MSETLPRTSMHVSAGCDVLDARPGTTVPCLVRVHNDGREALRFGVRVVGLDDDDTVRPVPWEPLRSGESLDLQVPLSIPATLPHGQHAVAIEVSVVGTVTSVGATPAATPKGAPASRQGRSSARPVVALAPLTVRVGSLDQVVVRAQPAILRGRGTARFALDIINRRDEATTVELAADADSDIAVTLDPPIVHVAKGETVRIEGRVRGDRHWVGEERQHIVNVEARGGATPSYTRVVYRSRPVVARTIHGMVAALALLSLWAAMLGTAAFWLTRDTGSSADQSRNATGQQADGAGGSTNGGTSGSGDGATGTGGQPGAAPGTNPAADSAPTETILRGVVLAGKTGDNGDVSVTLRTLGPDDEGTDDEGTAIAGATSSTEVGTSAAGQITGGLAAVLHALTGAGSGSIGEEVSTGGKFWSARYGTYEGSGLTEGRATVSVLTKMSNEQGVWVIDGVRLHRSYELTFVKDGFDVQSFIVTPPDDGSPVELNVNLEPASGLLGGHVVNSGGTPLGGVAITVTDGTFVYGATTATTGDIGSWSIEGLGTPNTFTVTAELDGYGTAVLQQKLTPGDHEPNLVIPMTAGVGSIRGTISGAGAAVGGITLTAAGPGGTFTTSTLTIGTSTAGTYIFPRLDIPGDYTVTVAAPGFVTQTRLVSLSRAAANASGVDFQLQPSTGSVIGVVLSHNPNGAGADDAIAGVGVQVRLENVTAKTTTVKEPDLGSFRIDELPPGTYTIEFSRYDHVPESRLITITAGKVLDLGNIVLTYAPITKYTNDATIRVEFWGSSGAQLDQVTVTLTPVDSTLVSPSERRPTPDPQVAQVGEFSVEFLNVPIGAYELRAVKTGYRPFIIKRYVVATEDDNVRADMLQYGQAYGQVVDGLAPYTTVGPTPESTRPLTNYRLLLYQVDGGVYTCRATIPLSFSNGFTWEVDQSKQLLGGSYRLRFTVAAGDTTSDCADEGGQLPTGYLAVPTDAAGNVGSFEIPLDNDDQIQAADIKVYPYPRISGIVFVPQWNSSTQQVELVQAPQLNGVNAVLQCGAGTDSSPLTFDAGAGRLGFDFTRLQLDGMFPYAFVPPGGSLGSCTISISPGGGYLPVTVTIPTPLTIPTGDPGSSYDDRVVAVVLTKDPGDLASVLMWWDAGTSTPHFVDDAKVEADPVITGYDASQTVDTSGTTTSTQPPVTTLPPPPEPAEPTSLSTNSNSSGVWGFLSPEARQVAGTSTYDVTADHFEPASFDLLVDDGVKTVTASVGFATSLVGVDLATTQMRLVPKDGRIAGSITVVSGDTSPTVDAVIHATPPGGTVSDQAIDTDGSYDFTAAAGTWNLDFGQEADSNLVVHDGPAKPDVFVSPEMPTDGPTDVVYWDLAQVSFEFEDTDEIAIDGTSAAVSVTTTRTSAAAVFPTDTIDPVPADENGDAVVRRLPVDAVDPTGASVGYRFDITASGFDLDNVTLEVSYTDSDGNVVPVPVTNGASFTLDLSSGSRYHVVVTIPAFGSIVGTVDGLLDPPSRDSLQDLSIAGGLTVSAQRVASDGLPLDDPPDPVPGVAGAPEPNGHSTYTIPVASGYYKVTYSYAGFDTVVSPVLHVEVKTPTTHDEFLDILPSSFTLHVWSDTDLTVPVGGATVALWRGLTSVGSITGEATYDGFTSSGGVVSFAPTNDPPYAAGAGPGVLPGSYLLVVRHVDPQDADRDDYFPVIAVINVPVSPGTLVATAVMPSTDGSIRGSVRAENLDGAPLAVPTGLNVNRTYTTPQAGTTDAVVNTATEGDARPVPSPSVPMVAGTDQFERTYTFNDLPVGSHTLSFDDADGFTTPEDVTADVDGLGQTPVDAVTYIAQDVAVDVTIRSGSNAVTGLTVTATGPHGAQYSATEGTTSGNPNGVYRFADLPPETGSYTLSLGSPYYRVASGSSLSFTVTPRSTVQPVSVALVRQAIIVGSAQKWTSETAHVPFTTSDQIVLLSSQGAALPVTPTVDAAGGYTFVVDAGTDVAHVRGTASGYAPSIVDVTATPLQSTTAPPIAAKKLAAVTLTVTGLQVGTTASATVSPNTGVTIAADANGNPRATGLDPDVSYTFTVKATNRMDQTLAAFNPDIGGDQTLPVVMEAFKTVTGTVTAAAARVGGASVALLSGSTVAGTATTDDTDDPTPPALPTRGTFSIQVQAYGTYTVEAQKLGVGAGAAAATVTIAPGGAATYTANVALTARDVTVTFTHVPSGVTVTLDAHSGTVSGTSVAFTAKENAPLAWQATGSTYQPAGGTVSLSGTPTFPLSAMAALTAQVDLSTVMSANHVTGTVASLASNGVAYLCDTGTSVASCAKSNGSYTKRVAVTANTPATYQFNSVPSDDYYVVVVSQGKQSVSGDFTVDAQTTTLVVPQLPTPS